MALTSAKIRTAKPGSKPYKLTDAANMYLLIHPNGSCYWRLRYRHQGKEKTFSLGQYPQMSLAEAREYRDEVRKLIATGVDPCEQKRAQKAVPDGSRSFETIARQWHASNRQWTESHRTRILRSLETHIFPFIGLRDISSLGTPDLLIPVRAAEAQGIYDVAARLQQRISAIMRFAVQSGLLRYNPAPDMAGALTTVKRRHRPALPLTRLPELLARTAAYKGQPLTRLAVHLSLLVFVRSSELRFARWSEIDMDKAIWTLPAERQPLPGVRYSDRGAKMRTPHLVPLSHQALSVLREIHLWSGGHTLVFAGAHNPHKPMSENTINKALRLMGYDTTQELCGHGFRAMACSALTESALWSRDAVERQMSHQERNGVRAAYIHKAEHLQERRLMLQWWADYLDANRKQHITPFDFAGRQP